MGKGKRLGGSGEYNSFVVQFALPIIVQETRAADFFSSLSFIRLSHTLASSSRRTSGSVLSSRRSTSPGGGSSAFASSSSSFTSRATAALFDRQYQRHRAASPTRVHLYGASPPHPPVVRFSLDRSTSPGRSLSVPDKRSPSAAASPVRRTCLCSPTTHPGSFRCSLHKGNQYQTASFASQSNRLNACRSAMKNSLVRIGAVEGDWVKRALSALIRPSSHQQRRRCDFLPRPSPLSRMSKAGDP
ncbi:uncharacterized protein LOC122043648 [Zingiber officinale]|uniref:uncharacterized protein LOC122043648 n=1 Tax=Zingiber officinale TaxID=94328 RepID=UPI001C4C31C0|nr:uncharacterized protein LOC122043648 [Zingiber officinale]